jgi:hypothetical protein
MLQDPLRSRVPSNVEVQDLPTCVLDNEEAVEQLEGHGRHGEEVESDDHLAVVLEEGKPLLTWVPAALDAPEIPSNGPSGDDEAEFLKFAVDFGGSPTRILRRQAPDQRPEFFSSLLPTSARSGTPTPVQPKTRAVPADDGLGLDDDQDVGPTGPEVAEGRPEEPVHGVGLGRGRLRMRTATC